MATIFATEMGRSIAIGGEIAKADSLDSERVTNNSTKILYQVGHDGEKIRVSFASVDELSATRGCLN